MRPRAGFEPALKRHRGGATCALPCLHTRPAPPSNAQRLQTPAAARAPATIADLAIALRAAKLEKPCDGGVFGGFYLLLFLQ